MCMTRSRPRVQGPRVVSDWSSTSCSDSGPRRGPPAPGPTQPAGETAHQPDAAGVVPPGPSSSGSLPRAPFAPAFPGSFSGWRPILPYYEDASQKDHESSSDSSWAAPHKVPDTVRPAQTPRPGLWSPALRRIMTVCLDRCRSGLPRGHPYGRWSVRGV